MVGSTLFQLFCVHSDKKGQAAAPLYLHLVSLLAMAAVSVSLDNKNTVYVMFLCFEVRRFHCGIY
jgi:hypothetical protein